MLCNDLIWGKKSHVFHIYFKFWMNYRQIQLNLISGFMRNYAWWLFLPCHNSICVNISGWNQRQIPNDNFANDFPNRKHREFWQRVHVPSAHNLGINPCYLRRMGLSAHGKYSGQQGLSGPTSLQLIHRSPAQWSDLHRVILTHWSLPFLRWKAALTMAALTSWESLQACRNSGYGGGFTYCFTIVTVVLITTENRAWTRFHCVLVLSVLVSVH